MYQRAEICLPRKKKVQESFRSNSFRIFDEKVPDRLNPDEIYKDHKYETRDQDEIELQKTHNVPQPYYATFIRTNVRFLNEPIAHIETESTMADQFNWWTNAQNEVQPRRMQYSKASTQRTDFQPITEVPVIRVRDGRNRPPTTGIIPALSSLGQQKELVEHMSFTHQYDCRRLHDQPYQGKRHGAFVWSERGAEGPVAFQSAEGLHSTTKSSQQAPLSTQRSTGTISTQPAPDAESPELRD